ncbi:MAG: 5-formyltetrahydrofolate cyclo-ligase, partial [Pseudomonadota bacterium]|nr:5-formyltetrahydrofolate cyclo-ligase [Pseudomonadota bacterium]
ALFRQNIHDLPAGPVSGFVPIRTEIDPKPLLAWLRATGRKSVLPIVGARDAPLVFRVWTPGDEMDTGPYGIEEPKASADRMNPVVLLVPMLAFDRFGFRLGYGGGYYDRTLAALRAQGKITAVGIAYSAQEVDAVPVGEYDQPLDWIVTEREAIEIGA